MKRSLALVIAAVCFLAMAPASAEHEVVQDQNDVSGRLDLRRVEMKEGPRRWLMTTQKRFNADQIFDKGYFLVYLDTFGDKRFDYYVLLRSIRNRIRGDLWRDRKKSNDEMVKRTETWRPDEKTITTTVPFNKIFRPKTRLDFRWHAVSLWSGPSCRRTCIDRAPNGRSVTELYVQPPT